MLAVFVVIRSSMLAPLDARPPSPLIVSDAAPMPALCLEWENDDTGEMIVYPIVCWELGNVLEALPAPWPVLSVPADSAEAIGFRDLQDEEVVAEYQRMERRRLNRIDPADLKSVALQQALHDLLLKKRNTFIAHADWTERKAEVFISGTDSIHAAYSVPCLWDKLALDEFNILIREVEQKYVARHCVWTGSASPPRSP